MTRRAQGYGAPIAFAAVRSAGPNERRVRGTASSVVPAVVLLWRQLEPVHVTARQTDAERDLQRLRADRQRDAADHGLPGGGVHRDHGRRRLRRHDGVEADAAMSLISAASAAGA